MNPLIFVESIVEPPSESLAIRSLCILLEIQKECDFLLETTPEMKDIYFGWIRQTGLSDFVKELIVYNEEVEGYRIAADECAAPYLVADRISYSNLNQIIVPIMRYV